MNSHSRITHQAISIFKPSNAHLKNILQNYSQYIHAGSYFPDWGYACANQSDASEFAHWPEFFKISIDYIRLKYPPPFTSEAKSLIAFFFGVISHGVADASWHSLDSDEGFIQASSYLEFNQNYQNSHSNADFGGEMALAHSSRLNFVQSLWKIPTSDLVNIYAIAKSKGLLLKSVTHAQINECMLLGYSAAQSIKLVGKFLYPISAYKSPFLVANYRDYFKGGVYDMVSWVVHCWEYLETWLINGTSSNFCKNVDLYWSPFTPKLNINQIDAMRQQSFMFPRNDFYISFQNYIGFIGTKVASLALNVGSKSVPTNSSNSSDSSDSNYFKEFSLRNLLLLAKELLMHLWSQLLELFFTKECTDISTLDYLKLDINHSFSGFGKSFTHGDFNGDGLKQLVISAPFFNNSGIVFVMNSNFTSGIVQDQSEYSLYTNFTATRFGYSIIAMDMNKDGIDDLIVSAPSHGCLDLEYTGRVYIYLGIKNQGLNLSPNIIIEPRIQQPMKIPGRKWENQFTVFGETLKIHDVNQDGFQDLIISSPHAASAPGKHQTGLLNIFYSSDEYSTNFNNLKISLNRSDISLSGSNDYELFGTSVAIKDNMMYIGSPGYKKRSSDASLGKIYGYKLNHDKIPQLQFVLHSDAQYSMFGSLIEAIDYNQLENDVIIVSSPSENVFDSSDIFKKMMGFQSGVIRFINVSSLYGHTSLIRENHTILETISGTHLSGRFGSLIAISRNQKSIWVSEPLSKQETGRIYLINSERDTRMVIKCIKGTRSMDRFGENIYLADVDNDGIQELLVTTMSGIREEGGSVYIVKVK